MRTFVRDADGCPTGEITGYDPDGFPEGQPWGSVDPEEGWDDDDQAEDVLDPMLPASEEDPEDYSRLFEPPVEIEGDAEDNGREDTT